jgi:hypothetical protein
MKSEEITKLTKDLSNDDLAALHDGVQAEVRNRRPKATLDMIKPGMTKEEDALVRQALRDAAKDLFEGR